MKLTCAVEWTNTKTFLIKVVHRITYTLLVYVPKMHSLDCKTRNQKDKSLAIKFFRKQKTQ